jgi:hypothetical protein
MSLPALATTALIIYAALLLVLFRAVGFGIVATIVLGLFTTLAVWGTLHLVYFSDFLYTPPISNLLPRAGNEDFFADPKSIGSDSGLALSWLPRYFAALGWWFGLAFYATIWVVARFLLKRWLRPNNSFKPKPLRGSA